MKRWTLMIMTAALATGPASAGETWAFVGTYTGGQSSSQGIYRLTLNEETGALSAPELAAEAASPSFLAIAPKGDFLFAVAESGEGVVKSFALDRATGALKAINESSTRGNGPCHLTVSPSGRHVLVANYGGGSVAVLPVDERGRLKPASAFVQHKGSSVDPGRQEGPHAHSINLDPKGAFAVVADLGLDQVLVYRFDDQAGTLVPNDPPFARVEPAGSGPRHFAFAPNGKFAYVINEMASTVTAFAWDGEKGVLEALETVSTLPGGKPVPGNSTAEVQVHPSGKFVYGSNRGHDSLAVFQVDPVKGTLAWVENEPTGGKVPRNFGVAPGGGWVLAANQDSGDVVAFAVDQESGKLAPSGQRAKVPAPVCVKFLRK